MNYVIIFAVIAVISYLIGSLNFGVIISNTLKKDDVRTHGSGNAGSTNMLRNYGKKYAVLTILGDMLKTVVAVEIAIQIISYVPNPIGLGDTSFFGDITMAQLIKSFTGLFCVLGHIFPCYFKFKGGKGVATAGSMVFIIDIRIALILLLIFAVIVAITKYVSLGSMAMAIFYPVFIYIFHQSVTFTLISVVFTIIVLIAHRKNIYNLIHHQESKITEKSDDNSKNQLSDNK